MLSDHDLSTLDGSRRAVSSDGTKPDVTAGDLASHTDVAYQVDWIGIQVRWIGLVIGVLLVNVFLPAPAQGANAIPFAPEIAQRALNQLLASGAVMMAISTIFIVSGRPLFQGAPLLGVLFEATFVTLLCYFDRGLTSPFRFYYFISLVIFALRFKPLLAWGAMAIYSGSYTTLVYVNYYRLPSSSDWRLPDLQTLESAIATVALLLWTTYVASSIGGLLQRARRQLARSNSDLTSLNDELEDRIAERTNQLKESQALLVQREKQSAFGLLAAGIAHEVGNPLAGISSVTQMLGRHLVKSGKQDDYSIEKLSIVDEQLRRIQRTLRELTDFSRPASPERMKTDVANVCRSALEIAKYYARRKNKTVVEDYEPDLPAISTVKDELVQIVLNLVLNAMDATEEGSTIRVSAMSDSRQRVVLRVEDDGCGIDPSQQDALFEPYFTTKDHGTGLGLFVCKRIVEQSLFGTIELESSRPGRTVFAVSLPVTQGDVPKDSAWNIDMFETAPSSRTDKPRHEQPDPPAPLATP